MQGNFNIIDESGDKKYFTQIPNYILNHSTLYDREVYIQMKRIAGEAGSCWMSQANLAKQCGISVNRLKKSIKYLVEHKWIKFIGKKKVKTGSGFQEVNQYAIADIWKLNIEYYENKGVSPNDIPEQGVSPDDVKGCHQMTAGVSPEAYKEEPFNNNHNNKIATDVAHKDIVEIINKFKEINPLIEYGNKTQRKACSDLIGKFGIDNTIAMTIRAIEIQGEKYAPVITTPYLLKTKLGELKIYFDKEKTTKKSYAVFN